MAVNKLLQAALGIDPNGLPGGYNYKAGGSANFSGLNVADLIRQYQQDKALPEYGGDGEAGLAAMQARQAMNFGNGQNGQASWGYGGYDVIPLPNGGYGIAKGTAGAPNATGYGIYGEQPMDVYDASGRFMGSGITPKGLNPNDESGKQFAIGAAFMAPMALAAAGALGGAAGAGAGGASGAGGAAATFSGHSLGGIGAGLEGTALGEAAGVGTAAGLGGAAGASGGLGGAGGLGAAGSVASGLGGGGGGASGGASMGGLFNPDGSLNWGSLIGPISSGVGALISSGASKDAANTQLQAAREAAALNEPFRQAGVNATNRLQELLGIGGNASAADYGSAAKDFSLADFNADPGYQFRLDQGLKNTQRQLAAGGNLYSGKAMKDFNDYAQGTASQEYGNAFNRYQTNRAAKLNPLQAMAGQGQSAANTVGSYVTQGGNAQAAGTVGSANAISNGLSQGYSLYQQNQLMNALLNNRGIYGN